jgi:hypothetical protein
MVLFGWYFRHYTPPLASLLPPIPLLFTPLIFLWIVLLPAFGYVSSSVCIQGSDYYVVPLFSRPHEAAFI